MTNEPEHTSASVDATVARDRTTASGETSRLAQVKERTAALRATVADRLESGADKVRQRSSDADVKGVTSETRARLERAGHKVAAGMDSTAEWVRTADVEKVRTGIEDQIRTRPGRSILIALGLGFVIGRLLKGRRDA